MDGWERLKALCAAEGVVAVGRLDLVRLTDLDLDESRRLAVREVDPETVARYTDQLIEGSKGFPPLLLERTTGDRWIVLGGMHRVMAADGADLEFWDQGAFTVPPLTVETRLRLQARDNADHGRPLTADEKEALVRKLRSEDLSAAQRGRLVGLSAQRVYRIDQSDEAIDRAKALGVGPQCESLAITPQSRLAALRDDDTFVMAVQHVFEYQPDAELISTMVAEVNAAGDGPAQRQRLLEISSGWQIAKTSVKAKPGIQRTAYKSLNLGIEELRSIDLSELTLDEVPNHLVIPLRDRVLKAAIVLKTALERLNERAPTKVG